MEQISTFSVTGFKCFNETVTLPIYPITVLTGLNNSGKSSLIQALLLLKRNLLMEKCNGERGIILTHNFNNTFSFNDNVNENNRKIVFSFETPTIITQQQRDIVCIKNEFLPNASTFIINVRFTFEQIELDLKTINRMTVFLDLMDVVNKKSIVYIAIEELQLNAYSHYNIVNVLSSCCPYNNFDCSHDIEFDCFLPIWKNEKCVNREDYSDVCSFEIASDKYRTFVVYCEIFQNAINIIRQELIENIIHLGSLRNKPYHSYRTNPNLSQIGRIGEFGENTIGILYQNRDKVCKFVKLPSNKKVIKWDELDVTEITLIDAINDSLTWLGLPKLKISGTRVLNSDETIINVTVLTSNSDRKWVNLIDIGSSVNQILPFLVMGLLSESNNILIFEHPEIHLQPVNQAKIAELLAIFAYIGKRVIIETYSESLINRLLRLLAEDKSNQFCNTLKIININNLSGVTEIQFTEYSEVINWPIGFLSGENEDARAIMSGCLLKRFKK